MSGSDQNNPFAALFSTTSPSQQTDAPVHKQETEPSNDHLDRIARQVFYITCQKSCQSEDPLVFLEDVASVLGSDGQLNITLLGEALFERLLLNDIEQHVISPKAAIIPSYVIEEKVISYLFECWRRLQNFKNNDFSPELLEEVETLIMRNISTSLIQPDLYPSQTLAQQALQLLTDEELEEMVPFMSGLVKHQLCEDGEQAVMTILRPLVDQLATGISHTSLLTLNHGLLRATLVLARSGPTSAAFLMKYSAPRDPKLGRSYAETLLGRILSLSCLPGSGRDADTIFNDVVSHPSVLPARESNIHMAMNTVASGMHAVFEAILRSSSENRKLCLDWMWSCLEANSARGNLWSTYNSGLDREMSGMRMVPDGFALNLEAVALKLCAPFCKPPPGQENSEIFVHPKLLTIDPSFCAVESGPFCRGGLHQQTCLMPPFNLEQTSDDATEPKRKNAENFTFITECFFLAQRATDLGSRVARERLISLNQDTARIERLMQQVGVSGSDAADSVRSAMERTAGQFLAYRTALSEPTLVELSAHLYASTSNWLVQLLLDDSPGTRTSFAPGQLREVKFPLQGEEDGSTRPAFAMQFIPELILESLALFVVVARKFHATSVEQPWLLWPVLSLVVSLMGSPARVKNPHVRARLAEVLETLLPWQKGEEQWLMEKQSRVPQASRYQRERIFKEHPHRLQIAESLVRVFVDIEMTGQSVAFEQKFSYRHPMYTVLEHLWNLPEHRACFKRLARLAQENMEAVTPPVFLRFVNLLINDAVFLLDEALAQMIQLRQKQEERENPDWQNLPAREREQNEHFLEHMGGLARSYNILGRETIHTLEMLTSEIRSLFCHPTMVDRIAAMLNYFLMELVGPKRTSLKVHNMKEFEFDPGCVVMDICRIYTHLGDSSEFCAAVSRDSRSYSQQLFPRAESVLTRIGGGSLLADLQTVAGKVAQQAVKLSAEEELLAAPPDDFLDPITAALMIDPVTLPSSQVTLDRPTIARHLLSDQTDPFNRSPLTMDQVIPNEELRCKIEAWKAEKKAAADSKSTAEQLTSQE